MASVLSDRAGPDASGLAGRGAAEISRLVREGRATAVDVAQAHLTRIADLDRRVGAFRAVDHERVLAEAAGVDVRPGRFALPLAGVPVAVEDDVAVAGFTTGNGRASGPDPAHRDDLLVRRLRAAGAVVVGKARAAELGVPLPALADTDPWRRCGGGAVAVAAGMAALALGGDGAGTPRLAAAENSLVALKPGRAAVPAPGGVPQRWFGLLEAGAVGRSAADVALLFEALSGSTVGDLDAVGIPRRVALSPRGLGRRSRPGPAHGDAVRIAARRFAEQGVHTVDADPPYPGGLHREWSRRWQAGVAEDAQALGFGVADARAAGRSAAAALRRGHRRLRSGPPREDVSALWRDRLTGWLDGGRYDVLALPAAGAAHDGRARAARRLPHLQAWNLAGLPAVVVAVRWGAARVPVQLVGRPGSEAMLLATAACLEQE